MKSLKRVTSYCIVCHSFETNGKRDLEKHAVTQKHVNAILEAKKNKKEQDALLDYLSSTEDVKIAAAVTRLCLLIAEKNLAICLADWLIPVLKKCFPDSDVLTKVFLGRTNCANVLRNGNPSFSK